MKEWLINHSFFYEILIIVILWYCESENLYILLARQNKYETKRNAYVKNYTSKHFIPFYKCALCYFSRTLSCIYFVS